MRADAVTISRAGASTYRITAESESALTTFTISRAKLAGLAVQVDELLRSDPQAGPGDARYTSGPVSRP